MNDLLGSLPEGQVSVPLPAATGEGIGFASGPAGEIWHWLRLDHGQITGAFPRDPAWILWPLVEALSPGAWVDDLRLILASFCLSCSGMDL